MQLSRNINLQDVPAVRELVRKAAAESQRKLNKRLDRTTAEQLGLRASANSTSGWIGQQQNNWACVPVQAWKRKQVTSSTNANGREIPAGGAKVKSEDKMFELKISADEPLIGVLGRIASGLEALTTRERIPGVYDYSELTPEAQATFDGIDAALEKGHEEPEETDATGKRSRPTKEEMAARRDAAKAALEAAGLALADVEAEIKAPMDKWSSKQCEKVHALAAEATAAKQPQADPTPPSADPELIAHAKANGEAGQANTPEQADALGLDQHARLQGLLDLLKSKYADPATAEALFKTQLKSAFGVEFMHQATHTPGFDQNFVKLESAAKALPGDPKTPSPAVEPEVLPPAAASDPTNEARIAYISQFAPVGEKFTALTRDNIVTLLREGKPLGAEDVRAFCIATVSYGKLPGANVNEIVRQFAPNVTALGPDQILPCIDALVAAANPQEAF